MKSILFGLGIGIIVSTMVNVGFLTFNPDNSNKSLAATSDNSKEIVTTNETSDIKEKKANEDLVFKLKN